MIHWCSTSSQPREYMKAKQKLIKHHIIVCSTLYKRAWLCGGRGLDRNEVDRTGTTEIRKANSVTVGKEGKSAFWPNPELQEKPFVVRESQHRAATNFSIRSVPNEVTLNQYRLHTPAVELWIILAIVSVCTQSRLQAKLRTAFKIESLNLLSHKSIAVPWGSSVRLHWLHFSQSTSVYW